MDSNTIKDFLKTHPAIKISSIEVLLKIPAGTIRPTEERPIPKKYIKLLTVVLKEYGLTPK